MFVPIKMKLRKRNEAHFYIEYEYTILQPLNYAIFLSILQFRVILNYAYQNLKKDD